jgi:hypothetical protein
MRTLSLVLTVLIATAPVGAQAVHKPAGRPAAVAGIAPPPAVVVVPGTSTVLAPSPYQTAPVFYGNVPVVVLPDGRVLADFGRGYEQIVRSCAVPVNYVVAPTVAVGQPTVVQPTVVQPSAAPVQPLPYTPAVPNQQTASQQMLNQQSMQVQQQAVQSTLVNSQACWVTNGYGQVFVARP